MAPEWPAALAQKQPHARAYASAHCTVVTRRAMTPSAPLMRHLGDKKQAFAASTASETDTDATSTISEMTTSQRSEAAKEAAKEAAARLKKETRRT